MPATDRLFGGSIPEIYERLLVPLLFEPYANDLAERVLKNVPADILETAAGTGVLTRAIASRLPLSAHIVATDLNQPMLDKAKKLARGDARVEWRQADAQALPFATESFDAVVCQFGMMFLPDKVRGYAEARRVLRPGGWLLFNVWDKISANDFADVVTQALATVFPEDPPQFLARTPHGHHDEKQIRDDLKSAGFTEASIDAVSARSKARSPLDVAIAYCQGTPLRHEIESRDTGRLEEATERAAEALARRFGANAIDGRIRAYVIAAARSMS
jgi:ubiquinone/menaquinone biosynthesis C-methylase UbiE